MKHQNPSEIASIATPFSVPRQPGMSRQERIERWAMLLDRHGGPLNALRQIEFLSPEERRAYRGANTPLTVAFDDPILREEGLKGDRLGDTMEFFGISDADAHHLLCDCRYLGNMTGSAVARRLRHHATRVARKDAVSRFRQAVGRFFGFAT